MRQETTSCCVRILHVLTVHSSQVSDLLAKISDMESGVNRQQYEASEVKVPLFHPKVVKD